MTKKIVSEIGEMNSEMIEEMKQWDMKEMLESEKYISLHQNFVKSIN